MGLDMYLTKSRYVGAEYEHRNVTGTIDIKIDGKPLPIKFKRVSYIDEAVCYWRKANQIHAWFVENVQDGEDNCARYYVDLEDLQELLNLCKQVQADHSRAEELLPSQSGFFFGNTEYDEWYFQDIDNTVAMLTDLLAEDNSGCDFYYRSSW